MKKLILLICAVTAINTGCSRKIITPSNRTTIIDTITKTVADSALIRAVFECDSLNNVRVRELNQYKGDAATQNVDFKDNTLKVETRWKTKYIDRITQIRDTVTITKIQNVDKIVTRIPTLFWCCLAFTCATIVYLFTAD